LNIVTGELVSEDELEAGYDGSDEKSTKRTPSKRKRKDNSSSEKALPLPLLPVPVLTSDEPSEEGPAAHTSYFDLLGRVHTHRAVGPGKVHLGIPVGVYTGDPIELSSDATATVYDRLLFHRVVFINFTTTGSPR
jgi:hypothetical protein